jgi:glycosyltransferase involved in cell wall biosynthesis
MKILFATGIYPPDAGGPATYTQAMAREFTAHGHTVEVVCYADGMRGVEEEGFVAHRVSRAMNLLLRYAAFAWKVFMRSIVMKADVVFLLGAFCEGFPGSIGALCAGKKIVMKIPGDYAWEAYQGTGHRSRGAGGRLELLDEFVTHRHEGKIGWIERLEHWSAKRAKKIIVPSAYLKHIVEAWGVRSDRVELIYNAIEPMPSGMSREEARLAFDVKQKHVIFWGGRAVPWKNVDFIIHLLPSLSDDDLFVVAGDGPSLESWRHESILLSIQDRVCFVGKLSRVEIGNWLRAADCFVLPSGYEGFPHAIPEAVSEGLPCFVSDRGGNPETRDLLGDSVQVLPYLDARAWISALKSNPNSKYQVPNSIPRNASLNSACVASGQISGLRSPSSDLSFKSMVERTLTLLQKL